MVWKVFLSLKMLLDLSQLYFKLIPTGMILKQTHSSNMNIHILKEMLNISFMIEKHHLKLLEIIQKWIMTVLKIMFLHS